MSTTLTTPLRFLRNLVGAHRARSRYKAAGADAGEEIEVLATDQSAATCPFGRMLTLLSLVEHELTMSQNAHGIWHPDALDADGHTLAESHDLAARLIDLVGYTEAVLATAQGDPLAVYTEGDPIDTDPLVTGEVRAVLDALCAEPNLATRGGLVLALHAAVVGEVGEQAAEALAALAACYFQLSGMTAEAIAARVWPTTTWTATDDA